MFVACNPKGIHTSMTSTSFAELGVPADLVAVLEAADKTNAFPIQQATLPSTLAGKDVLGRGKTGSGKTLAFSIPLVTRVAELKRASGDGRRPKGLVLLPTRELATQVAKDPRIHLVGYGPSASTIGASRAGAAAAAELMTYLGLR